METTRLQQILKAALLAAHEPVTLPRLTQLFVDVEGVNEDAILQCLEAMLYATDAAEPYQLKLLASGYTLQIKAEFAPWIVRLWEEKPAKYTRAFLETLAIIAYRQPVTRGEIEDIRGVAVSTQIIKTLLEREWVRVLGQRDVPGKPSIYGTTKTFLDYFNLASLEELPPLADLLDLDKAAAMMNFQLNLEGADPLAIRSQTALADTADELSEVELEDAKPTVPADAELAEEVI